MRALALGALVVLAGCGDTQAPVAMGVDFVPDAGGLAVAGTAQRIDFGRAPSGVIVALDRELGGSRALGLAGCPADVRGQMAWGDLVLTFADEQFIGWRRGDQSAGRTCT